MGDPSLRDCPLDCKVYVGNLGNNGNKTELERSFGYYGPLRSVWVARNPPGFAFVEFEDPRDATDAVRELDGRTMCGCRVRVELSNGEKRSRSRGPPPSWSRRPRDENRRRSPPVRRRSPRRRSFSRSRSRSVSRDRRRDRSLSRERNHKPSRSFSRSRSRSRSNDRKRRKLGSQRKSRGQHRHDYPPESKDHGALIFGEHLPPTEPLSRQISGDATLTFDTLNKCDRRANCFNVVMVGSSNVGKTSFMKRIQSGSYSPDFSASIGIDTCIHALPVDGREVMLQIWDTAGQERFHSISKQIFHKGQAFLLMYDITSSVSFTDVRYWISCIQESAGEEVIMLLLGNKSDCAGREVTPSEGKLLAKEYNIDFNECSVATGEHIVSSIESLARKLTENYHKIEEDVVLQQPKKRCC
ncbi:unnamed protein product [Gadus morhua 'NCC']